MGTLAVETVGVVVVDGSGRRWLLVLLALLLLALKGTHMAL